MCYGTNMSQSRLADDDMDVQIQDRRTVDGIAVKPNRVSNWAWVDNGRYDWMDSHVPSASLE
ncbi:hypothetical protein [Paraburkholderia sp. HD33-4]|uniref:hypothetical protein n=1 Tax=Paraburkholderia sp. HD33-4 TaxID=2883242 RepID=UPI001F46442B|nr:hypothetical protein [Paraburkholderia sp. HD33-4]